MQYTSIIVSVLATIAAASPVANLPANSLTAEGATAYHDTMAAQGCNWVGCISSLAGETAACAAAAAEGGLNPIADVACLASVGSSTSACNGC